MDAMIGKLKSLVRNNFRNLVLIGGSTFAILLLLLLAGLVQQFSSGVLTVGSVLMLGGLVALTGVNLLVLRAVNRAIVKSRSQFDAAYADMQQLLQGLLVATTTRNQALIESSEERIIDALENRNSSKN